jgi:multidrug efflux pump subunit AcrA (membrane-fusion protein)
MRIKADWRLGALAALAALGVFWGLRHFSPPDEETVGKAQPVSVREVGPMDFREDFSTQGTIRALRFAAVTPKADGTILEVYVREGDRVRRGQPLFRTDNVRQEEAYRIAQRDVDAASFAVEERTHAVIRARAELERVELDLKRFRELLDEGAISQSMFDDVSTRYRQAKAMYASAQSMLNSAQASLRKAQGALNIARKNLSDTTVVSPMDGMVSRRLMEPGEMGRAGVPVLRIDDPSQVEVLAYLPSEMYPKVVPGVTRVELLDSSGAPVEVLTVKIKSPVVDPTSRSFEVRCLAEGGPSKVPGAMAELRFLLGSSRSLGIPRRSVVHREEGDVIYTVSGDVARMVRVVTGLSTDGHVELVSGDVKAGDLVVVDGAQMLDQGSKVKVVRRSK